MPASDLGQESALHGDMEVAVSLDPGEQSGSASASVRIHASREVIWPLITTCAEARRLVPGLVAGNGLETAADGAGERTHQVLEYSWFVPKLAYEIRASYYQPPSRVSIERVSGDLLTLRGSWVLQSDGDYTIAHYTIALAPGFWVPHWMVRAALRHDLPKMVRAPRARAEFPP